MKMVDGVLVPDDTIDSNVKETVSKFAITDKPPVENDNKTIIGGGKTVDMLAKEAELKNKLTPSNRNTESKPKIKHADNLIKLLSGSFANSRERVKAENKIRQYFDNID